MLDKTAIIIFSKTPEIGRVKTRLIPELGEHRALDLYKFLLAHTIETVALSQLGDVFIDCMPSHEHPLFKHYQQQYGVMLRQQQGNNLGDRMFNAIQKTLIDYESCILIGSDCLEISKEILQKTLKELQEADLVLGPAHDGGYYLIAANKIDGQLFNNIPWGTDAVLFETRHRLQQLEYRWTELCTLTDIDTYDDLVQLKSIAGIASFIV